MPADTRQLDLLFPPRVRPAEEPPAAPPPAAEPVRVQGQLGLLEARSTRLAPAVQHLAAGRFAEAASAAAQLPEESALAAELARLAESVHGAPSAEDLAGLSIEEALSRLGAAGTAAVVAATRRGIPAAIARRLDEEGPAARARAKLSAHYWLLARRPADALAATERLLAESPADAGALVLQGNCLYLLGDVEAARARWWRALRGSPQDVRVDDIADEDVRALAAEASELGLAPPEPWMPFVGLASGLFAWADEASGGEPTPADRFAAALARSRAATVRGRPDVEARREMRRLAPELFARLLEARCV